MRRLLTTLCLLLAPSIAAAQSSQPAAVPMLFRHINTEHGLPQNTVMATLQDSQGFIWLATEDGLSRYDGYEIVRYGRDRDDPESLASSFIWSIAEDRKGDLWVATKDGGLAHWSRRTDSFTSYRHDPADPSTLSSDSTRHLLIDRAGRIWVGTVGSGLNLLDPDSGEIRRFRHDSQREDSLASDVITALHEDADGHLWIGTAGGLHRLLPETGTFRRYRAGPRSGRLSSDKVSVIDSDRDGTLWVGTFDAGLNRFDRERDRFSVFRAEPGRPGALSHDEVRAVLADSAGRLWIGTANGLDLMDRRGRFTRYARDPADPSSLADNYVMSLYEDRAGLIWVGTRAGGVSRWNPRSWLFGHRRPAWLKQAYVMSFADDEAGRLWIGTLGEGLHRYDPESGAHATLDELTGGKVSLPDPRIMSLLTDSRGNLWIGSMSGGLSRLTPDLELTTFRARRGDPQALAVDGIMALLEARDGRIWLGTFGGGVNILDPQSGLVQRISYDPRVPDSISAPRATSLAQDPDGFVWVGTEGGGLDLFDENGRLLRVFRHDTQKPRSLSADTIYSLHVDAAGRVWIGTDGGGLDLVVGSARDPDAVYFRNVSKKDGLSSDIVYSVRSDAAGQLWLSSNAGLTRYQPDTGNASSYHREHGLQGDEFNFGSSFRSRNGTLCFGGADGFNVFDPSRLTGSTEPPSIVLTRVEVMNQPAETELPYPVLPSLLLGFRDDVVSFEFAALDFTAPQKNRYAYRLKGFDGSWVELGNRRRVSYTNLEPGEYLLEVRAANPDGAWSEVPMTLPVTVLPAPWQTLWARLFYACAAALFLLALWQAQRRKLRLASLARERLERQVAERTLELRERNDELARVSRAKSEFLSRMSHEIRTPMNGVIGMTDLLGRTELSRRQAQLVTGIHGSARSLLQILNEILDLARVESGKLKLEETEFDLRESLEDAVGTFAVQAEAKGLELTVSPPVDPDCRVIGDPLRIRQILQNLVGNALKFTSSGEVTVIGNLLDAGEDGLTAAIEVHDTGIGMSAETVTRVFDPFSQADESTTRQFGGTGLGLTICRQLAELMGGVLDARSEPGIGSTFTLTLPLRRSAAADLQPRDSTLAGLRVRLVCRRLGLARAIVRQAQAWGIRIQEVDPAEAQTGDPCDVLIVDADSNAALLERLRPRRSGARPPALVLLAGAGASVAHQLEERFGSDAIVVKPARHDSLRRAIALAAGLRAAGSDAGQAPLPQSLLGRVSGHVLVVEDNSVNAAVAEGMLAELGCTVTVVEGGRKAVARAIGERFDLILMDLHMPDLDGMAATALIRKAESSRRTPIVALTADAAESHRERCLAADMDDFLGKPFTLEDLHATLSRWLPVAPAGAQRPEALVRSASASAGLDPAAIARIRALDRPARPRLLPKVVAMYVANSTQQIKELHGAFGRGDLDGARGIAHSLKSASANVGAAELARLANALEKACSEGDEERAQLLGEELAELHPATVEALRQEALQDTA